jgi:hypothetical protein
MTLRKHDFSPWTRVIGPNHLNTSSREKARIPAWCDRILWKGSNLRQLNYNVSNLRLSDHRPVWASFACSISVVDEARKEDLRHILHGQRRSNPQVLETQPQPVRTEKGDPNPIEPNFTGLPPPSSDHRKWWLDNGKFPISIGAVHSSWLLANMCPRLPCEVIDMPPHQGLYLKCSPDYEPVLSRR